jgi:hypothetical protein
MHIVIVKMNSYILKKIENAKELFFHFQYKTTQLFICLRVHLRILRSIF